MKKKAFTLVELILIIVILGILSTIGIYYFGDTVMNTKIEQTKARMKAIEIALKNYYADVNYFPTKARAQGLGYGDGTGTKYIANYSTLDWSNYLVTGNPYWDSEDTDSDGKIDNWAGPYIRNESILKDAWGHRFLYKDYTTPQSGLSWEDMGSAIISMGPKGVPDGTPYTSDTNPGYGDYGFSFKLTTKDLRPPDSEGFSIFPLNGNNSNLKKDFIIVLWLE